MKPYRTTQTETKICPIYGRQSPTTNKYCVECGYEISEISFFPQNNNNQPQSDRKQNQQSQTIYHSPIPKKTRRYGWLIFFLALAALLIYTNPDQKMNLDFIRKNIGNEIIKKGPHLRGNFKNLFESTSEEEAINNYFENNIKRTNYIFFSLTEIQIEEKWEPWAYWNIWEYYCIQFNI